MEDGCAREWKRDEMEAEEMKKVKSMKWLKDQYADRKNTTTQRRTKRRRYCVPL